MDAVVGLLAVGFLRNHKVREVFTTRFRHFVHATRHAIGAYLIFFDEADEGRSFDFDGLAGPVVEGDDEVEEIRFAQIRRRLLFKVGPADAQSEHTDTHTWPRQLICIRFHIAVFWLVCITSWLRPFSLSISVNTNHSGSNMASALQIDKKTNTVQLGRRFADFYTVMGQLRPRKTTETGPLLDERFNVEDELSEKG